MSFEYTTMDHDYEINFQHYFQINHTTKEKQDIRRRPKAMSKRYDD